MSPYARLLLKLLSRLLTAVVLIWGGAVNLFLLGVIAAPRLSPVMVLLNLAAWITLLTLLVFACAFTLRANGRVLAWLAPGVIAFVWWFGPAWLPKSAPDADGVEFTALTFNVLGYQADPAQTFAVIRDADADIVALQELRPMLQEMLQHDLADEYPYQVSRVVQGYDGFALLSRYPIVEHEILITVDFNAIDLDQPKHIRAVLDIDGQHVVVYVVHPPIPSPNPYVDRLADILFEYDDTFLYNHITRIADAVKAETLPTLVLCDCNSTPLSRQHALLDTVLDDAFGVQGWGLGFTHPVEPMPALRIDYIWYTGQFVPLEAKVWPDAGTSDHYPLWGRLVLRPGD